MDFILPTTITDALLTSSTVPETDYAEWVAGTAYTVGDKVMVATSVANIHKIYECLVSQSAGLTPDLLDENCSDVSDWTNTGTYPVTVSPAGQFEFKTGRTQENVISRTIASTPSTLTVEIKIYNDDISSSNEDYSMQYILGFGAWSFFMFFSGQGIHILKDAAPYYTQTGTVKYNATAAWQTWRFEITDAGTSATCAIYLKEEGGIFVLQDTVDCFYSSPWIDGAMRLYLHANPLLVHIDSIRIATGLGKLIDTSDTPVNNSNWMEISATNRWKCFDGTIGNQTSQATSIQYVLTPGAIDSIALLNLDADSVRIQCAGAGVASNLLGEDDSPIEQEQGTDNVLTEGGAIDYDQTYDTTGKSDLVVTDLLADASAVITITIAKTTTAKVGEIILGNKSYLGSLQYSPSIGIKDWSTKEVDVYGHYTITARTYSKWMQCSLVVLNAALDALAVTLATYRTTPLVWVGSETYTSMILYGYYTDFSIVLSYPAYSIMSLQIEGLT